MKRKGVIVLVSILVALMLVISSCATKTTTTSTTVNELKIGAMETYTGPQTNDMFQSFLKTWTMQAEQLNATGGLTVAGKNYHVTIVPYDDQGTVEGTVNVFNKMKADGVTIFFGPSVAAAAIAKARDEAKMLEIDFYGGYDNMQPYGNYDFKLHVPGNLTTEGTVRYLADAYPQVKRYTVLGPDNTLSHDQIAAVAKLLNESDLKGRFELTGPGTYYLVGTTDFTPMLTKVLTEKPDIINPTEALVNDMLAIMKQARDLGYTGMFQGMPSFSKAELDAAMPAKYQYGIVMSGCCDWSVPPSPLAAQYHTDYLKRWGQEPVGSDIYMLVQFPNLMKAIREANSLDTTAIVKVLESWTSFPGVIGTYTWGGKQTCGFNHVSCGQTALLDIKSANNWVGGASPVVKVP